MRSTGLPYAILRPCGVSEDAPAGRLVLSTGDVATGSISRADVAEAMVSLLAEPAASGKTIEAFSLPSLPKRSFGPVRTPTPLRTPCTRAVTR